MRHTLFILILILFLILPCIFLFQCSKQPVTPDIIPEGYKKISISSLDQFYGDLSRFPEFQNFYKTLRMKPDSSNPNSANKQAMIDFKEAKVVVVNLYNEQSYFNSSQTDDFYCNVAQTNYNAFAGKRLDVWNDLISGIKQYGYLDVVYTGTLERNGNYVEGDILVKPGLNTIIVCFINSSGKIFWTSYNDYLFMSQMWKDLFPQDTSTMLDGWADSSWNDETYYSAPAYGYGSCPPPQSYSYMLPGLTVFVPSKMTWIGLGISKEFADWICTPCLDTGNPIVTSTWKTAGTAGFSQGIASQITLNIPQYSSYPYVTYVDQGLSNRAVVQQYNGASWTMLGGAPVSIGSVTTLNMSTYANTPYVAFNDSVNSRRITVKRWTGAIWDTVGNSSFFPANVTELSMTIDPSYGYIYVGFIDPGQSNKLTVMQHNGLAWDTVGNPGFSPGVVSRISLALNGSGVIYAAYKDFANGLKVTVMKYDTGWSIVGTPGFSTSAVNYIDLKFSSLNDTPYVAYDDGSVWVKKFNGTSWMQVGATPLVYYRTGGLSLASACGTIRVAFSDGTNSYFYAAAYELNASNAWTTVGVVNSISSESIGYPSIANDLLCKPYFAFQDGYNGNRLTVMYYGQY